MWGEMEGYLRGRGSFVSRTKHNAAKYVSIVEGALLSVPNRETHKEAFFWY